MTAPRCRATRADGAACSGTARADGYCFAHSPELAERRAAGRRAGGKERSRKAVVLPAGTADLALQTVADVVKMLATTINEVRRGQLDAKVGNCLGVLAGVLLRALAGDEVERRLLALEIAAQKPARLFENIDRDIAIIESRGLVKGRDQANGEGHDQ